MFNYWVAKFKQSSNINLTNMRRYKLMKNYKAQMTAQNMEITEYNKESLARLMIFATVLDNRVSSYEINNTMSIIKDWNVEVPKEIKSFSDFVIMKGENWIGKQDLSDYISLLVDILSESDFFDIQKKSLSNTLSQYSKDFASVYPNTPKEEASKINYSNVDFSWQFYGNNGKGETREISQAEKYANLMYLSNQLSHAFKKSYNGELKDITNPQITHIAYELMKIKKWSMHKLIEQKREGAPIDIALSTDVNINSSNNGVFSVSLPNYLEPFIVHCDLDRFTDEEKNLCDGSERFAGRGFVTTFPQYLSEEKMKLLEEVYKEGYSDLREANSIRASKLRWLFETKRILASQTKKQLRKEPQKGKKSFERKSDGSSQIDIQKDNVKFFEIIQKNIGTSLPYYFKEGFLKRTSYSLPQYMGTIYAPVKNQLLKNGVKNEDIDKEFSKLFIYMKMVKPLSIIAQKSKAEKVDQALVSLDEYSPVYDFIIQNLDEEKSYEDLKSKARKYANSIILEKQSKSSENTSKDVEITPQADLQEEILRLQEQQVHTNQENADLGEQSSLSDEGAHEDEAGNQKEYEKVEPPEEVALPAETVQALVSEIEELNLEMGELSIIIQNASKELMLLQNKLTEVQVKLDKAINSGPSSNQEPENR